MNNCLAFRRLALVNPHALDAAALEHKSGCRACAQFHERTLELDDQMLDAARLPAPVGLADQILEAVVTPSRRRRHSLYALAATLLLGITFMVGIAIPRDDPLALAGIEFVVDEEASAILSAKPSDPAQLVRVAQALGVQLPDQLGTIRYIGTCPFAGGIAHHVVIASPTGKVTLLLLPDRQLAAPASAASRGFRSLVKPARNGSVAIIASTERSVSRAGELLVRS